MEIAYRPTYRQAIAPEEAACMMAPAPAKKAAMRRAGFRPSLSEIGFAIRAPAKAPACITETMLAERFEAPSLDK